LDFLPSDFIVPPLSLPPAVIQLAQAPAPPSKASPKLSITASVSGVNGHPKPLNLPQWQTFIPGPNNAITDVPGLTVGQVTFRRDTPTIIRTGVTAIVPDAAFLTHNAENLATTGFRAAVFSLSGNGELTGGSFINEFGVLNGPILLTNTRSVGMVYEGVVRYFEKHHPGQWSSQLPVVGECWDGYYHDIERFVVPAEAVEEAIQQTKPGPVPQGRVGAGTGMRSFELHAGIGSSSRQVTLGGQAYTIGVLVNSNHSRLKNLNPLIRQQLETRFGSLDALKARDDRDAVRATTPSVLPQPRQGSIQIVIATDLPLSTRELTAMGWRAGLGVGHTGSAMATSSGDFVTVFSTANPIPMGKQVPPVISTSEVHPDEMTPVYRAVIEAVIEAQLNAIIASHTP
jgi:D-aminopeptidase